MDEKPGRHVHVEDVCQEGFLKAEDSCGLQSDVLLVRPFENQNLRNKHLKKQELNGMDVEDTVEDENAVDTSEAGVMEDDGDVSHEMVADEAEANVGEAEPEFQEFGPVEEEGRDAVGVRAPLTVSKEKREVHERTHTPYRSWCTICVKARGQKTKKMARWWQKFKGFPLIISI